MNYKLLALDMDGTLLNSDKIITPDTLAFLEKLSNNGVNICLSTGRGWIECEEYLPYLQSVRYGILNSGAVIMDLKEDKYINCTMFPEEYVKDYVNEAIEFDCMVQLHFLKGAAVHEDHLRDMEPFHMGIYQDAFNSYTTPIKGDILTYAMEHIGEITKICAYNRSIPNRDVMFERVKHMNLEMVYSEITSIEATARGISKGEGLRRLCDHLGISTKEAVAVGDALNDMSVLEAAGLSVAMGNALDEVKAKCDIVTGDNDHDGIAMLGYLWE